MALVFSGSKLKQQRTRNGLTLENASRSIGVTLGSLWHMENGTVPNANRVPAIIETYGCEWSDLYEVA